VKNGWKILPFEEVIADVSGGNVKTLQGEFLPEGRFAIVDQGKELISGYTNEEKRLCHADLPVIIFGDHTRCFKFVDFPFCMGADGVKVLRPKVEAEVKYLYYYLSQLHITDAGYSRHYKYLKQSEVVLPPLEEQKRIADILDRAEALRAKRRAALAQLDELVQSIFIDMFGDPVTNPKSWDTTKLGECTEFITSGSRGWAKYYSETGEKFIRIQNVRNGRLDFSDIQLVEPPTTAESIRTKVKDGDLLISITADLGRTAVVDEKTALEGAYINQHLALTRLNKKIVDPVFVSQYLESEGGKRQFSSLDQKGVKSGLNFENVKSLEFYLPPLDMQKEFSLKIATLENLKVSHKSSLAELDELFASLQYRAFRGELSRIPKTNEQSSEGVKI
jgi:type I restriction enzyme S subunit